MVEEWKAVVYEDGFISQKYIVSDMGRIYNKVKGCLYDGSINNKDVVEIRKAFKDKPDNLTHAEFCKIWCNKKQISKSAIENVIYNKSFKNIKI